MGIIDSVEKTIGTVTRTICAAENAMSAANRAKQVTDNWRGIGEKMQVLPNPLNSDAEKQKGVCASCALARMQD